MKSHTTSSPLVAFLYQIMRDEILVGTVERIVSEDEKIRSEHLMRGEPLEFVLTNGYLGAYAEFLAKRLLT